MIASLFLVLALALMVASYVAHNRLRRLEEQARSHWDSTHALLSQRHDVLWAYLAPDTGPPHELTSLWRAVKTAEGERPPSPKRIVSTDGALMEAFLRWHAQDEQIISTLGDMGPRIDKSLARYDAAAAAYNATRSSFPSSLVASVMRMPLAERAQPAAR